MSERPVGLTKDAGWEVGVSRTLPLTVTAAWDLLLSPEGLSVWLGEGVSAAQLAKGATYTTADGTEGEVRSLRPLDRVRLTWRPPGRPRPATVQVALSPRARGSAIQFHAEKLADADERERMRAHWRAVLDRLAALATAPA